MWKSWMFEGTTDGANLGALGIKLTKLYLIFLFAGVPVLAFLGAIEISPVTLNEFGDLFAGAFGPLAIFWVVLGFFQQGHELRNSVATLELQANELANSVEQQKELVEVTREQLEHERQLMVSNLEHRRDENRPKLIVSYNPSVRTGANQAKYELRVQNTGGSLSCVQISVKSGHETVGSRDTNFFDKGEMIRIPTHGSQFVPLISVPVAATIEAQSFDESVWTVTYYFSPSEEKDGLYALDNVYYEHSEKT